MPSHPAETAPHLAGARGPLPWLCAARNHPGPPAFWKTFGDPVWVRTRSCARPSVRVCMTCMTPSHGSRRPRLTADAPGQPPAAGSAWLVARGAACGGGSRGSYPARTGDTGLTEEGPRGCASGGWGGTLGQGPARTRERSEAACWLPAPRPPRRACLSPAHLESQRGGRRPGRPLVRRRGTEATHFVVASAGGDQVAGARLSWGRGRRLRDVASRGEEGSIRFQAAP